jgi:hypothetical protein
VAVSNPGVAVGSVTVVSDKRITATLTIGATAALGAANMTVTTSAGTSAAAVFTVNPSAPTITSISPAVGVQGAAVPVTLTGTNFISGATVAVSNPGIGVSSVVVVSATQIAATLTIAPNAALGAANVTVATSGGTSNAFTLTVNPPAPTLTSVGPATGVQGASVPVNLSGTNFVLRREGDHRRNRTDQNSADQSGLRTPAEERCEVPVCHRHGIASVNRLFLLS